MPAAFLIFSQSSIDPAALVRAASNLNRSLRPNLELSVLQFHSTSEQFQAHAGGTKPEPSPITQGPGVGSPAISPSVSLPSTGLADVSARLVLQVSHGELSANYHLLERAKTAADLSRARSAEQRSNASGMSDLAARCAFLWELHLGAPELAPSSQPVADSSQPPSPDPLAAPPALDYLFCALLAGVALGPVMPADDSALFGVRGARLRAGS